MCDLETSRIGAPYIHDISSLRVKGDCRVKHDCDMVDVTQETVWHQQGTRKFVPGYDKCLSFGGDRVPSSWMAVQLTLR